VIFGKRRRRFREEPWPAVLVTFVVYAVQMVWLSRNASRADLIGDALII